MASPSDARSATSGGSRADRIGDLDDFFGQLDLEDEVFDDLVIDDEIPEINERVRWMALARVHTDMRAAWNPAFFKDMRAAWNPAQPVKFKPKGANLFVVQASCLGDWERIMYQGPWLFRFWAVLLHPYDGFSRVEDMQIVHMPIWLQIHKLPEGYCSKDIVEKLIRKAGEIMEFRLAGNSRGNYVRIKVKHDVREPLTKHVSIIKGKERQVFAVRYEKLARFCKFCGRIGHEFKECGSGVYTAKELKFGDWLYADPPNMYRAENRGSGRTAAATSAANGSEDLHDTMTTPIKNLPAVNGLVDQGDVDLDKVSMDEDKGVRKRLLLEGENGTDQRNRSVPVLAITAGNGEDDLVSSPTSSSESKRAKTSVNFLDDTNNSAGSREEPRREQ